MQTATQHIPQHVFFTNLTKQPGKGSNRKDTSLKLDVLIATGGQQITGPHFLSANSETLENGIGARRIEFHRTGEFDDSNQFIYQSIQLGPEETARNKKSVELVLVDKSSQGPDLGEGIFMKTIDPNDEDPKSGPGFASAFFPDEIVVEIKTEVAS